MEKYLWLIAAGLSGGLVGQYIHQDPISLRRRAFSMLCGVACAVFLTPTLTQFYGITDPASISGVAFVVGMFWLKVVQAFSASLDRLPIPWGKP